MQHIKKDPIKVISGTEFLKSQGLTESQANFNIWWNPKEAFSSGTKLKERVGDKGKLTDSFVDRARKQMDLVGDIAGLEKNQDSFKEPDWKKGDVGREKNRNYNRMEYDFQPRFDGYDAKKEREDASEEKPMTVEEFKKATSPEWWINTLTTAVSNKPITAEDYNNTVL
jgi:hypothetical protein